MPSPNQRLYNIHLSSMNFINTLGPNNLEQIAFRHINSTIIIRIPIFSSVTRNSSLYTVHPPAVHPRSGDRAWTGSEARFPLPELTARVDG